MRLSEEEKGIVGTINEVEVFTFEKDLIASMRDLSPLTIVDDFTKVINSILTEELKQPVLDSEEIAFLGKVIKNAR